MISGIKDIPGIKEVRGGTTLLWSSAVQSFDPDYQAVLDYATANAIELPTAEQQTIDNQVMIDYKAAGKWEVTDFFYKLKSTGSIGYRLIDWKRLVKADAFGSVTWDSDGATGNGTNAYIDIKYNPAFATNLKIDNAGVFYVAKNRAGANGGLWGSYVTTARSISEYISSGSYQMRINGGPDTLTAGGLVTGAHGAYRETSTEATLINNNGTYVLPADNYIENPVDNGFYLLALCASGSPNYYSKDGLSYIAGGASFKSAHEAIKAALV